MLKGFEPIFQGRLHPAGRPFVVLFACVTFLFFLISQPLGALALILTLWCAYFFRDPARVPPELPKVLVAPADGLIVHAGPSPLPKELEGHLEGPQIRVSIFLNVFDVHVNRIPTEGRISLRVYHPGKFLNASLDKASDVNERNTLVIDTPSQKRVAVVQIAGFIARRIVCDVNLGDEVTRGEKFGIIRFGSRVDLYLPSQATLQILNGQKTIGGETIIATLP